MLKKLRKRKTAKRIWIILTILILPAFLFWGVGSFMRNKEDASYVGKIAGRKVSLTEYKEALAAARNQAIIQFGENISEVQDKINLGALAWNRLILLTEAKRRNIKVGDREVIELIQSYPFFQRKGRFDDQIYSQMLQYVFRTQPRVFEEETRQNLILSKLYEDITANLNLSEEDIREEYVKLNEELSIYYIAGLTADFMKETDAPEAEVKEYFAKNQLQLKEPLSFNIEYVSVGSKDQDLSSAKERIKSFASRLNKKEDFAKSAAETGLEVKETGLFSQTDPIPGIGWSPQIMALISNLKAGELAGPVYLDGAYYVLRLKEKKEPYIPEFETIKEKVKEVFIKERARESAKARIEACLREFRAVRKDDPDKTIDLQELARKNGLKTDSTGLFKYGSYIEGIGSSDVFFTVAQPLKEGEISGIIEMPSGFYVIKLKSRVPVDEKLFNEEKTEFAERLLLQKREEYFNAFLEGLLRKTRIAGY